MNHLQWYTLIVAGQMAFASTLAHAQVPTDPCDASQTQRVYFGNGIWIATPEQAADAKEELRSDVLAGMTHAQGLTTCFDVAYNHSLGRYSVGDVFETARQILGNEYPSLLIGRVLNIVGVPRFLIPAATEQQLNELLRSQAARELIQGQTSATDVADHVSRYKSDLEAGRKVVVVAHSQGNLFANLAFEGLPTGERESLAMVPVASPDSVIKRSLVGHVTFLNDLVIDLVQVLRQESGLGLAPLPNDLLESPQTFSGHEFVENYLTDESSTQFIVQGVITSLRNLPSPTPATSPTFFSDNFESYAQNGFPSAGGWFIRPGASGAGTVAQLVTTMRASSGAQSLQLSSTEGLGVNVQRLFTPPTHPYALEAYINTTRTDSKNAFIGFGNADNVNAGVRFVSGRGIAVLNSETVPSTVVAFGGGYDADIWIKLRIVVDPATNTYAVYKNNVLATQGLSAAAPTGPTDRIWIGVDNSGVDVVGGTTAYFDDVSVVDCPSGSTASACGSGAPPSSLITFVATGTVTQRDYSAGVMSTFFATPPEVGDTFTLRYTFDQSTADADARSNIGIFGNAVRSAVLTVGSNTPVSLAQTNFVPLDQISTEFSLTDPFNNYSVATGGTYNAQAFSVGFTLGGAPAGYFTSDALPSIAPAPAVFLSKTLSFSGGGTFTGTLSSLTRQ